MEPVRFVDTGVLYCDDNLERLRQFPNECVDLVYLDPPFFSNRHYEVIWGDEAEVRSFEDRWEGGIQHYINWMEERLVELHRVLRPTGSIYLHCDFHANAHLRLAMDSIFGAPSFRNEIAWCYYGPGSPNIRQFLRKHDTVFWYSKSQTEWTFNRDEVRMPHNAKTLENFKVGNVGSGFSEDETLGQDDVLDKKGKVPEDWWVMAIAPRSTKEYLGYPTQKPEALLERIVAASSRPGEVVLDPFCGCGTTVVVAERLRREWIGIDISPTAVTIMNRRILKASGGAAKVELINMPTEEAELRSLKPFEFQNWVIQRLNGTHSRRKVGDMGIDGYSFMSRDPIQVKQSERVGRNVVDNFETAIERAGQDRGYIIAFSFTRGAHEEAARARATGKADI